MEGEGTYDRDAHVGKPPNATVQDHVYMYMARTHTKTIAFHQKHIIRNMNIASSSCISLKFFTTLNFLNRAILV